MKIQPQIRMASKKKLETFVTKLMLFLSKGKKRGAALVARQQMERSTGRKKTGTVYDETLDKVQKNREQRKEALRRMGMTLAMPIIEMIY